MALKDVTPRFIDIKIDAANLIDSNMKTALTALDFYPKVGNAQSLHACAELKAFRN